MTLSRAASFLLLAGALLLAACQPTDTGPQPTDIIVPPFDTPTVAAVPQGTPPPAASTSAPAAKENYCKNGGAVTVGANDKLAARVNGQPVPLSLYERQAAQEQAALAAQGVDLKSKTGLDALKGLQEQSLGQLIDNVLIEQAASQENVTVTANDVNNRIQDMLNEAGGRDKFDQYLKSTGTTLDDLCIQIRASLFGEVMLKRVTAALPTKVEQVHAAHILLATQDQANQVLAQVKANKDFGQLAKQYSQDEGSRDNGGDLGWFPKGNMPPEFEAVAFQLQPGQVSGVVTTALGFHIIKVLGHEQARELSPDLLQFQRQQAFLAWLDARRNQAKIEKLITP